MNKVLCSARGIECDCRPDECKSAPVHFHVSKRPPLINFTPLEKALVAIVLAAVLFGNILAFTHARSVETDQAKINQELTWTK